VIVRHSVNQTPAALLAAGCHSDMSGCEAPLSSVFCRHHQQHTEHSLKLLLMENMSHQVIEMFSLSPAGEIGIAGRVERSFMFSSTHDSSFRRRRSWGKVASSVQNDRK